MEHTLLSNAAVVLPDRVLADHSVLVGDGLILAVAPDGLIDLPAGTATVDVGDSWLGPGFVDLHCHGGGTAWFHADPVGAAEHHLRHGTTALLATTLLYPTHAENLAAVTVIAEALENGILRNVVGINMEGPYLNPELGAFRERSRLPDPAEYLEYAAAGRGWLRWMTIAPELPGIARMVYDLQRATGGGMVFSVGHSRASLADIRPLVGAGLRMATHLTNATGAAFEPTRWAGTREVGVDEAVLLEEGIVAEVIADSGGCHVRPDMLRLLLKVKGPDGLALVTDATPVDPGFIADPERPDLNLIEGGLAGSHLTMDAAVSNFARHTGCGIVSAWRLASYMPASAMGRLHSFGWIAPGRRADLVVASGANDGPLSVEQVWLAGKPVNGRP